MRFGSTRKGGVNGAGLIAFPKPIAGAMPGSRPGMTIRVTTYEVWYYAPDRNPDELAYESRRPHTPTGRAGFKRKVRNPACRRPAPPETRVRSCG